MEIRWILWRHYTWLLRQNCLNLNRAYTGQFVSKIQFKKSKCRKLESLQNSNLGCWIMLLFKPPKCLFVQMSHKIQIFQDLNKTEHMWANQVWITRILNFNVIALYFTDLRIHMYRKMLSFLALRYFWLLYTSSEQKKNVTN